MLVKIANGAPVSYSLAQLYLDHPNVSFPAIVSADLLATYSVFSVIRTPYPGADYAKNVVEGAPQIIAGQWTQTWVVTDATPDEITERTERKGDEVRIERNELLSACDWTQVADAPVDQAAWAAYRQALRDVTAQSGFPWEIVWPTQPE